MKFIYQPISPFVLHQTFGQNKACVTTDGTKKVITCDGNNPPPGYKSLYGPRGHLGLDLKATHGQPVYCVCEGIVSSIDTQEKSGLDVRVVTEYQGQKYRHIYEHLMGYQPKVGDKLETGSLIGWADNTGYSSGDHLHFQFEIWDNAWVPINPMPYMFETFALNVSLTRRVKELIAILSEKVADMLRRPKKT